MTENRVPDVSEPGAGGPPQVAVAPPGQTEGERAAETLVPEGRSMEIHPPERPIHSMKDFLFALTTITIGILIAMSLEGVVQWMHHRALVREAKTKLAEEMRDNRREMAHFLATLPAMKDAQEQVLRLIDDLLGPKQLKDMKLNSSYDVMTLSSTGWNTAQAAGAVGYMDYADVQKYSSVYTLQTRVEQLQNRVLDGYIAGYIPAANSGKETERDLLQWKQNVLTVASYLDAERQMAEALLKQYDEVLSEQR